MEHRDMRLGGAVAFGERRRLETLVIAGGMVLLGVFALVAPAQVGAASLNVLGVILLLAGGIEMLHGVLLRGEANWAVFELSGVFSALMGLLMLLQPETTLGATTFLVAGYFFVGGLFRAGAAVLERYPGWGWHLAAGAASLALGAVLVARFPWGTLPIISTLVGLELLLHGLSIAGSGLRREGRHRPGQLQMG